ncbi:THUMP domain-containing class I SAM-dependent RNA methyltransferase [Desulfuromonas acetexigens]|uniref:THUMP domain-containing class I SAM-dependent RNA methyltransferase n=1 Tax=Trichloromonas acetexigens TaxID=38815 RepID=UPI00197AC7EC|nr:RNA methyltransferase [Desulfuromonas acetexigens]
MKNTKEELFAVTPPGLEEACAAELLALGLSDARAVAGGVEFAGGLREIYLANLHSRVASRVLVRLASFKARDFPDLYRKASRLPWGRFLRPDAGLQTRVTCHHSRLNHSERIAAALGEAADRALGREAGPRGGVEQLVLARFEEDICQLSIDSSGELLHRRGYRGETAQAPLRENLAAGILLLLGWNGTTPLVDPLCGSGTFLVEGVWLARRRAPGLERRFAFMDWPGFRPGLWEVLTGEARRAELPATPILRGGERDAASLEAARRNAARAGVAELLELRQEELADAVAPADSGLLLCNPPYGKRVGAEEDLRPLYRTLGRVGRERFPGWRLAFLCPDDALAAATELPLKRLARLRNGGIPITLWGFEG